MSSRANKWGREYDTKIYFGDTICKMIRKLVDFEDVLLLLLPFFNKVASLLFIDTAIVLQAIDNSVLDIRNRPGRTAEVEMAVLVD